MRRSRGKLVVRLNFDEFSRYYSIKNRKPNLFNLLLLPFVFVKHGRDSFRFLQLMKALRLDSSLNKESGCPEIELLVLCHHKDIDMLPHVIQSAINTSFNPVSKVIIVCPEKDLQLLKSESSRLDQRYGNVLFEYLTDYELLGEELYSKMLNDFPDRFGWVAQQFLTVSAVLKSGSAGVLQVDCDTSILTPTTWLLKDGRQVIRCSTEYHLPYYKVIQRILGLKRVPRESHVCHQMLFQPALLRKFLSDLQLLDLSELYDRYLLNSNDFVNDQSRFCAKYELYAYLLIKFNPEKVIKLKFSNISLPRKTFLERPYEQLNQLSRNYSSLSTHSYLVDL